MRRKDIMYKSTCMTIWR